MKVDKILLNTMNKKDMINIVRCHGPVNRAKIASMMGLSITAVMKIADELIDKGVFKPIGRADTERGKPPEMLIFNASLYSIIGVDVGTTKITAMLMDMEAKILYRHVTPTSVFRDPETVVEKIIDSINRVLDDTMVAHDRVLGIGIGVPGLLNAESGHVVFSPDLGWKDVAILHRIGDKFRLPAVMENVTRAIALGERWFGFGREAENFICVNLGYGIGSAIVLDGELYRGYAGFSGEMGHMKSQRNGPRCDCGNEGCLEAVASANAISKLAVTRLNEGAESIMNELAGGDLRSIDAKIVYDAAKAGDLLALEIVDNAIEYLGETIASLINFMDPELVLLCGGVSKAGDFLTDRLQRVVTRHKMSFAGRDAKILVSLMGEDAAVIGAATLVLKKYIDNGGAILENQPSGGKAS